MTYSDNAHIFYGTRGPRSARIMICGESWGRTEMLKQQPFVGESGQDLDKLLGEAKVPANEIFFTNVISEQPYNNDMRQFFNRTFEARKAKSPFVRGLFPKDNVLRSLDILRKQIELVKPEIIIGFGNYSLWALTDDCFNVTDHEGYKVPSGIGHWRGSQLYTSNAMHYVKFLPTYHPAAGLRTYPWRYMIRHDLKARVPLALTNHWDEVPMAFTVRPSFDEVTQFLQDLLWRLNSGPLRVVLDLETRSNLIACCGLTLNKTSALCIPFMCVERDRGYWNSVEEEFIIVKLLRQVLMHPNMRLGGQNLLYDLQYITDQLFCTPRIADDSMIMHHTVFPGGGDPMQDSAKTQAQGVQRKALYNLSSLYCEYHRYWKDEGKHWAPGVGEEQLWTYNCRDCAKTYECIEELDIVLDQFNVRAQYEFQLRVANDMILPMMLRGILTDDAKNAEHSDQLTKALDKFDESLALLVDEKALGIAGTKGSKPWYRSSGKQRKLFYDILGVKPVINKKTKKETASKDALPTIALREPILAPICARLELRRSIGVYYSTFIKAQRDQDRRLRCSYNLTGTDTFRLSSSENVWGTGANLQNIPSGKEAVGFDFPNVKEQFIPDIGYELAEFDLSGADAQVVAWEANDEDLKEAFRQGLKLHIKNARDMYPEKTRDMTDADLKALDHQGGLYHNCKRRVHGTNYLAHPKTLSEKLHTTIAEEEEFQERWFYKHPGILEWHRRTNRMLAGIQCWQCQEYLQGEQVCPHCGVITGRTVGNKFGNRIIYFDRVHEILSKAVAWGPQSTVAINCNKGAINLVDTVPWCELLLQVHDSLIVQYPTKYSDRLIDIKTAIHSVTVPYKDPLTIPWGCKVSRKSWGEAETLKW